MTSQHENLTLLEAARQLLTQLQRSNDLFSVVIRNQQQQGQQLAELIYLLNGFSSGGASFSGYIADPMTQAYLAVVGPLLAAKLSQQDQSLPEMMKGSTLLAKQLIEELAAYRSERGAFDYLEDQAELIHDPWNQAESPAPDA
jgi:hypothetical protein